MISFSVEAVGIFWVLDFLKYEFLKYCSIIGNYFHALRNRGGIINTRRKPSLSEMASSGQNREQTPHPRQELSSRCARFFSFMTMASVGHHSTQMPQPVQAS